MTTAADVPDTTGRDRWPAMDLAVDAGFAILLLVCALRYFQRHPLEGEGVVVLVLAIAAGTSYAVAALPARRHEPRPGDGAGSSARRRAGVLAATAVWLPLVVLAPSFAWCAFALFFAVHRVLRGPIAFVVSGALVLAVSVGLYRMSAGDDLGLVLGTFLGGLVLSAAFAAVDRALRAQRTLIRELVATRAQLAAAERAAGALAERGRVASELHDTVVQRTAGALLLLESQPLDGEAPSSALGAVRADLRDALAETRQVLHGLADTAADGRPLAERLRATAEDAGAVFTEAGSARTVAPPVGHALQRVLQESLVNIAKHAGAEAVHVTLTWFDDAVGLDVADDGVGFDPAAQSMRSDAGFGLRAMAWRVRDLGGTLAVESERGRGTVVAALIPVEAAVTADRDGGSASDRDGGAP